MLELNKIYSMDCLEGMKYIDNKSIDMILCDLPYGTTACKWDIIIPFELLWEQYNRIIKDNGAIVLFGTQPFTSLLIASNISMFKYCWVWNKKNPANFFAAKYAPLKIHEDICVFSKGGISYGSKIMLNYYPIMTKREKTRHSKHNNKVNRKDPKNKYLLGKPNYEKKYTEKYPQSIIEFSNANHKAKLHPTEKPIDLCEYLIKTYTKKENLVLDNCIGSGTTAVACVNTERNYIGFDNGKDDKSGRYWADIANERIEEHKQNTNINIDTK